MVMVARPTRASNPLKFLRGPDNGILSYRVTVRAEGYESLKKKIRVRAGKEKRYDFRLKPAKPVMVAEEVPETGPCLGR